MRVAAILSPTTGNQPAHRSRKPLARSVHGMTAPTMGACNAGPRRNHHTTPARPVCPYDAKRETLSEWGHDLLERLQTAFRAGAVLSRIAGLRDTAC